MPEWLDLSLDIAVLMPILKAVLVALATILLGWFVASWAKRLAYGGMERARLDVALAAFLSSLLRYVILFAVIIAAAGALGFETTSLLTIFASAGLAVGLALQGTLANLAAGVVILFNRPFTLGDVVSVAGKTGLIHEIGLFATVLQLFDGGRLMVPNSQITGNAVENHTATGRRRITINIGVEYGTDLQQAKDALIRAVESVDEVLEDPAYTIIFMAFGDSSLDWEVRVWCLPENFGIMQENVRFAIYRELNAADIGIPFPQLTLWKAEG